MCDSAFIRYSRAHKDVLQSSLVNAVGSNVTTYVRWRRKDDQQSVNDEAEKAVNRTFICDYFI